MIIRGIIFAAPGFRYNNINLFYLLQLNIISLSSPKITLALLFITCFLEKWDFIFALRKTGLAKTGAAGPFPPALIYLNISGTCTSGF